MDARGVGRQVQLRSGEVAGLIDPAGPPNGRLRGGCGMKVQITNRAPFTVLGIMVTLRSVRGGQYAVFECTTVEIGATYRRIFTEWS